MGSGQLRIIKKNGEWPIAYTFHFISNLIGSGLTLLCLQSHSEPESHWTYPEVLFVILGADQKERGLWGRECYS